jgi:hypothetical protein
MIRDILIEAARNPWRTAAEAVTAFTLIASPLWMPWVFAVLGAVVQIVGDM